MLFLLYILYFLFASACTVWWINVFTKSNSSAFRIVWVRCWRAGVVQWWNTRWVCLASRPTSTDCVELATSTTSVLDRTRSPSCVPSSDSRRCLPTPCTAHSQAKIPTLRWNQGRINHSGPHTNVRRGPFSRMRSQDFLISGGFHYFPKKLTTFLVVTFECWIHWIHWTFKRQNSVVKIWQLIGGGPLPWYNRHNG